MKMAPRQSLAVTRRILRFPEPRAADSMRGVMNYAALFGFIIRLIGLYFLYRATLVTVEIAGFFTSQVAPSPVRVSGSNLGTVIFHLLAAMWFFKGAPPYSGWAYRELDGKRDAA